MHTCITEMNAWSFSRNNGKVTGECLPLPGRLFSPIFMYAILSRVFRSECLNQLLPDHALYLRPQSWLPILMKWSTVDRGMTDVVDIDHHNLINPGIGRGDGRRTARSSASGSPTGRGSTTATAASPLLYGDKHMIFHK